MTLANDCVTVANYSLPCSESGSSSSAGSTFSYHCSPDITSETASLYTLCSQQSSSNLTASDIPGAGRTLGLLYARWGRALEASVGCLAHKRGHGPDAVAAQIARMTFRGTRVNGGNTVEWTVANGDESRLNACCQRLVGYTRSNVPLMRMRALEKIIEVITAQPRLRPFFRTPGILNQLRDATRHSSISSSNTADWIIELEHHQETEFLAGQTLLCIEQNSMNKVIDDVLQLPFVKGQIGLERYAPTMLKLLECCRSSQFSFVAKRHMYSALNYLPWCPMANWNIGHFWSQLVQFLEYVVSRSLSVGAVDLEGTERLLETLLLPRCRALHTLHMPKPRDHSVNCRCMNNRTAKEQMRNLLDLLKSPGAQYIFPRAAAIADDIWTSASFNIE